MTTLTRFSSAMMTTIFLMAAFACKQNNSNQEPDNDTKDAEQSSAVIETFTEFPPEISGCSCYFSNDSSEFNEYKYIYISDLDKLSFMKINGVMVPFTQTDFQKMDENTIKTQAKNPESGMTIEVIEVYKGGDDNISVKTGTIKLTDNTGKTVIKSFFGECGC